MTHPGHGLTKATVYTLAWIAGHARAKVVAA